MSLTHLSHVYWCKEKFKSFRFQAPFSVWHEHRFQDHYLYKAKYLLSVQKSHSLVIKFINLLLTHIENRKALLFSTVSYKIQWIRNYLHLKMKQQNPHKQKNLLQYTTYQNIFMYVYIHIWTRVYLWGWIEQERGSFSSSHLDLHQLSCQLALHLSAAEMLAWLSPHICQPPPSNRKQNKKRMCILGGKQP